MKNVFSELIAVTKIKKQKKQLKNKNMKLWTNERHSYILLNSLQTFTFQTFVTVIKKYLYFAYRNERDLGNFAALLQYHSLSFHKRKLKNLFSEHEFIFSTSETNEYKLTSNISLLKFLKIPERSFESTLTKCDNSGTPI